MARELNIGIGTTGLTVTATPYLAGVAQSSISLAELGATGVYQGDMTGGAGSYTIAFISSGVTRGSGQILWDGTAEILIDSRMATYTQPAGFLAATFPAGTVANTTNITAGTIATVTNVTMVNGLAAAVITAASIAADAITDEKVAADVTIASVTGAVGSVTGAVGSVTGLTAANLDATVSSRATPAQVKTQMTDALNVDTVVQPGQENPAVAQTMSKMIAFLYKAFRNKVTQDATTLKIYADDAVTVDQKSDVSDDATTFTRGKIMTGP